MCSLSLLSKVRVPRTARSRLPILMLALVAVLLSMSATASPADAAPGKKTVAVLYFDYAGNSAEYDHLSKALAQMLISDLVGTSGVDIVERTRLEEVYAELDLTKTKRIDRKTAIKLGKLLNAHYLVFGSYFFDGTGRMYITGRVTHVETGKVLAGLHERREGDAFWELEQHLAGEIRNILSTEVVAYADARAHAERKARKRAKRVAKAKAKRVAKAKSSPPAASKAPAVGGGKAKKLDVKTAARYGKALDAMDRGDRKAARAELRVVVKDSPNFELASIDLASLAQ